MRIVHASTTIFVLLAATTAQVALAAGNTELVSVSPGGTAGDAGSTLPLVSANGRFVAFQSDADNLVLNDVNGWPDVFVRDRQAGSTELVSVSTKGAQADGFSARPSISAGGRFVAFNSDAANLVADDNNGALDVFVRDRKLGSTELVSVSTGGAQGDGLSGLPSVSASGRFVAFDSSATNLVPNDTNADFDVFVRDRKLGTTERVSVATGGHQGNGRSTDPVISANGRFVVFASKATNLVPGDTNRVTDIFVRDRKRGTTERVSIRSGGAQADRPSSAPSISADGRFVAFTSRATNLTLGDTSPNEDVFVRDRHLGTTETVSVGPNGVHARGHSHAPSISKDGRFVAFVSGASNLVQGDANNVEDVFVRDRRARVTILASVGRGRDRFRVGGILPSITADGRAVAFSSGDLVPEDTNGFQDVYIRLLRGGE